ncbi:Arc family DNA-binding protein [Ramlibacter sp.]|uniref:Arc family DNA-binding protein n=1 Tax=Ramlibacter sp. TaxID=1917967 RepID=UPI002619D727|nr:Arc family DNA-binding protein [Ramlibacter sp.]
MAEKQRRAATSNDSEKFIVRLPDGMRTRIAEAAAANHRTMNAEVVSRLQQSFERPSGLISDLSLDSDRRLSLKTLAREIAKALRDELSSITAQQTRSAPPAEATKVTKRARTTARK